VAETVVAGMIVGETMADFVESSAGDLQVSTALVREFLERSRRRSTLCCMATEARTPRR
jgi:fumarate reductase flavoprotein subunit